MSDDVLLARPPDAGGASELEAHLNETQTNVRQLASTSSSVRTVGEVAAKLHDFGKLTEWFQTYIRNVARAKPGETLSLTREQRRKKQHARVSAYAVEYALSKLDISTEWRTFAFVAVAKHHQSLPNTQDAVRRTINTERDRNERRFELIKEQVANIHTTAKETADALLNEVTDGRGSLDDFAEYVLTEQTHRTLDEFEVSETSYEKLLHLWGVLVSADKLAAAGLDITTPPSHPPNRITGYIEALPEADSPLTQELNTLREEARQGVLSNLAAFADAETNLATITLPTGFGKTLTGLQSALTLAGANNRVIYAFPYTSILDQTDEVIQSALNASPTSPRYTIHHHLAETRTLPDDSQIDTDAAELLAETWQSPLVLTTFVQLFESLAGPTNSQSVKIPSLENAVVLLDEPQALPERWWRFITWTIALLNREFNATVVFMTATQPRLLENLPHTDSPYELVEHPSKYFDFLGENPRVTYRLDDSVQSYIEEPRTARPRSIEGAVGDLLAANERHILSVGNTVDSVRAQGKELYSRLDEAVSLNEILFNIYHELNSAKAFQGRLTEKLLGKVHEQEKPIVATLTSHLRPIDRTILLRAIRSLLESDRCLYVASTQLIEAGVDVSFDRVHRDLAPLPSLIQSAGRCNREFGSETAEVVVWRLASLEHDVATSDIIYRDGYNLLGPTRKTLEKFTPRTTISEREMAMQAGEAYFQSLHTDVKPGDRELVEHGERAEFGALGKESLIPQQYPQVDLYIAVTANERQLFDAYKLFAEQGDYRRLRRIRLAIQSRQVSVPAGTLDTETSIVTPLPNQDNSYFVDATSGKARFVQNGYVVFNF